MASQATRLQAQCESSDHPRNGSAPFWLRNVPPFLRWAGGKRQLINELIRYLPKDVAQRKYHEPFLGAGSLFFRLSVPIAFLADANEHLIETYKWIAKDSQLVAKYLQEHALASSERHYYQVRQLYNRSRFSAAQAARFIYLNKTCFNGIFRVNRQGRFNVPYGWKEPPAIPNRIALRQISECLKTATVTAQSFDRSLQNVRRHEFVYLDPPYPALNGTSFFTHYTPTRFSNSDQERLAGLVRNIDTRGALFLMTNADTPLVRKLYRDFRQTAIPVVRFITCKSQRHVVSELVIRNFT